MPSGFKFNFKLPPLPLLGGRPGPLSPTESEPGGPPAGRRSRPTGGTGSPKTALTDRLPGQHSLAEAQAGLAVTVARTPLAAQQAGGA